MPGEWAFGAQAVIVGSISGQQTNNVLHFGISGPADVTDPVTVNQRLKELANAIRDCVIDTLLPATTENWRYIRTDVKEMMLGTGLQQTSDEGGANFGAAGVQGVNVASQLVHVRTAVRSRRSRGRNFYPPAGENVATSGEWDAAALALLAAFCACMAGKFIGAGATTQFRLGVLSREIFGGLFANWDTAFFEATELEPEIIISTMGTRRKGRGA